jgi:glycogen operon protein
MMRNFLATLAFSQGVPMISHGDEIARTQRGNNNAYCQDNEITWIDWELDERRVELLEFTRKVLAIRQSNPVLRRRRFFRGQAVGESGAKDLTWLRADGHEMTQDDWHDARHRVLGMLIDGDATDETDARGRPIRGDTLLVLLNAGAKLVRFAIPAQNVAGRWAVLVDTALPELPDTQLAASTTRVALQPHSLMLLAYRHTREGARAQRLGVDG